MGTQQYIYMYVWNNQLCQIYCTSSKCVNMILNSNRSSILELHVLDNVLTEFSHSCRAGKQELQSLKSDDHPQTGRSRVDPPFHFLQNQHANLYQYTLLLLDTSKKYLNLQYEMYPKINFVCIPNLT